MNNKRSNFTRIYFIAVSYTHLVMEENKRAAGRLNEIRQRRIRNRRMIVGLSFVVFAFCIVMGIQMVQKNSNLKKLKEQESKLAQQYQQELQISENLKDKEQYVHTDEYLEEMARKMCIRDRNYAKKKSLFVMN